mgnify:CR=1 FL=1|jgi:hypothetical protein
MANIKEILSSYGSAARANYPQGDDVEDDMNYIVSFIEQHGYEFQDNLLYECDRLACSKCNPNCYRTSNVSHAKHFEYENGTWVERIRKDNKND